MTLTISWITSFFLKQGAPSILFLVSALSPTKMKVSIAAICAVLLFAEKVESRTEEDASKFGQRGPSHVDEQLDFFQSSSFRRELFGGEDLFLGLPWWHEVLSENAASDFGFSPTAAAMVAWHADHTDSYAYNPFYWFKTVGFDRFRAARSLSPDLAKVHNDDLFSTAQVISAQYRYMTGCLVGLHWAAQIYGGTYTENVDALGAAHNILGVTLHALQDFYSHSNWIDEPSRRKSTFLDFCGSVEDEYLYTGSFEEDGGIKSHGKYSIVCSLTAPGRDVSGALKYVFDLYCVTPLFSNTDVCKEYRDCDELDPTNISGGSVLSFPIPDGVIYYAPPGINLDNSWQANIGVQVREIELNGTEAFSLAKRLAVAGSSQFLKAAERFMIAEGHQVFWNKVKTTISRKPREEQFESFNHFPFQFISAGPYPIGSNDEGYYLRVVVKTSNDFSSGTNADIKLSAQGQNFSLDYMPGANPIIGYNDFETGDETVYTVGPFDSFPSTISIKNVAPDLDFSVFQESIVSAFVSLGEAIRDFFLNNADYVGTNGVVLEPSYLNSIPVGGESEGFVNINGGSEGNYNVNYRVSHLSSSDDAQDIFQIRILSLQCIEESGNDGGTNSDEPFLMSALIAYSNPKQYNMTSPFQDVDSGETVIINHDFKEVVFQKPLGAMVLTFRIWESDDETLSDRNDNFNEFKGEEPEEVQGLFQTVGEAILADWKLDWIRAYAFHRGRNSMKAGGVLYDDTDRWIEGSQSQVFSLEQNGLKSLSTFEVDPPDCSMAPTSSPVPTASPTFRPSPPGHRSGVFGDPHISTFDRLRFSCQAYGVFTTVTSVETPEFRIQELFTDIGSSACSQASVSTGIVVNEPGLQRVQVSIPRGNSTGASLVGPCPVDLFLDGALGNLLSGTGDSNIQVTVSGRRITLRFPYTGVELYATVSSSPDFGCFFQVQVLIPYEYRNDETIVGLLGTPDFNRANDWVSPDGSSYTPPATEEESIFGTAYNYCVENWCARQANDSLFSFRHGETFLSINGCDQSYTADIEAAIASATDDIVALCGGRLTCLVDGACGRLEDALAAMVAEDELINEQEEANPLPSASPSSPPSSSASERPSSFPSATRTRGKGMMGRKKRRGKGGKGKGGKGGGMRGKMMRGGMMGRGPKKDRMGNTLFTQ